MRRCSPEIPNILWVYQSSLLVSIALLAGACSVHAGDVIQPKSQSSYQAVTGEDGEEDRRQWDRLYRVPGYVFGKEPASFVRTSLKLLPRGRALDLGMGEGRNAAFLAKNGWWVDGVDISEVAIRKAKKLAQENGVSLTTINADLGHYEIEPESYEVVMCIDFFLRGLLPKIRKGLKPGGVFLIETGTPGKAARGAKDHGPQAGELRAAFPNWEVLVYRESAGRVQMAVKKPMKGGA